MATDAGGVDVWVVQPRERARYEEQFKSLNPINGIITGQQARGFFVQSQLPVDVLGQIWSLSDIDSDGRLDINEFSIACKLINLKLRGFPLPSKLPPGLEALAPSSQNAVAPPIPPQPNISQQSIAAAQPIMAPQMLPSRPPQPVIPQQSVLMQQPIMAQQPVIPQQPIIPPQPVVHQQPLMVGQPVMQPMGSILAQPVVPPQPMMAADPIMISQTQPMVYPVEQTVPVIPRPSLTGLSSIPAGIIQTPPGSYMPAQAPPIPPQPFAQVMPMAPVPPVIDLARIAERKASIESPSTSGVTSPEWGVPHSSKLKYTQLFNTHDRMRSGFLSAVQARDILMSTRLPQKMLAQVWTLADTDNDGRLSCEEFVLAMHLCDMAREGQTLPAALSPDLIPPTMRRKRGSSFSLPDDKIDPAASLPINNITFEDKRKENFDKGQAELDRRRAVLLEAQRKEREERERKEREEEERREQLRLEQEARRQAELQEQLMKQRELEQQQEEQRRRAQEQREAARKEAERQRQEEWERARTLELETQRMREQETVLRLKAKNQNLAIELSSLTSKVKELSSKITETRSGVSAVKTTIDGMRSTRDSHMSEMASLKAKLKEQNQRLLLLTQEKAKLEAKNKVNAAADAAASEQARVAFTNKQITIKHLTEKLEDLQKEVEAKTADVENNNQQLSAAREELKKLIGTCENLYDIYAEKRDAVLQLKAANTGGWGAPTSSWDEPAANSWDTAPPADTWNSAPEQDSWGTPDVSSTTTEGTGRRCRALYEFSSRNPDELSLMPGDLVMVSDVQSAEPGWLMGELRGASGWFPESYVEPIDGAAPTAVPEIASVPEKQPLEGILEVPEVSDVKPGEALSEMYVAVYPYQSAETGDLSFEQGERVMVIKKEGDWWTGTIGDRMGIFPSNYVQLEEPQAAEAVAAPEPVAPATPVVADQEDDVFLQPGESKPLSKSPAPAPSGRETPADFERNKPATPDFSSITAAQTKMGKKGEIATVIAPYQATSSEQLTLARGQLVCIRKKTTTGWWEGELQAKGKKKQIGWFPASYVKVMASRRLSQTTPDFEAELNAQKVLAMFPYKAQNEDELTFEKDDVIIVLSRDDAAWWKGDLRGTVGLFPSNYVMPIDNPSLVGNDRLRQEAIRELVESERAYTNDMAVVRQVFEKPLARSGLVTREQLGKIFLNWREILRGNHHLLKLFEEKKAPNGTYDSVGDILCDNLPRMSAYIRFCSCQLSAGALLQELTDSSTAFRELCRQCQRDPRTKGLPLSTFLIKPMQRITKYSLLISKIIEHTPKQHPDRPLLEEALQRADELCSQVNEGIRERENAEWLEWLQSHVMLDGLDEPFVFNSVTKHLGPRKFLHHSPLTKTRSGRDLFGFLLNDCLLLAQPMKPLPNGQITLDRNSSLLFKLYKKPLLVNTISVQKSPENLERSFIVTFPKGQCAITAPTSGEAAQWIKKIRLAQDKATEVKQKSANLESKQGAAIGRLLIEVVEAVGLDARCLIYEMKLGLQTMTTPPSFSPFKWNYSMQFLVRDIDRESITLCLMVHNEYAPNELLDRSEITLKEIHLHSHSNGNVLREINLKQYGNAQVHVKFHLSLFK